MPNFDTGNLVVAQTMLTDRFAKPEMRMKPAPAFALLSGNTDYLMVEANILRTREDRPIEAHLLKRTKRNTGTARTHNHTGTLDDSMKVTLNWSTRTDKTTISLKLLDKSVFEFNTVLANKLLQCMMNILEDLETDTIAYLVAQRSQVSAVLAGASFNTTNDCIDVPMSKEAQFFQLLKSAFRRNKHSTQLDVIADSLMFAKAEFDAAQGSGNDTNRSFQFNGMNIAESIELADANYTNGLVVAMPSGTACVLNWIPKQNREGYGDYSTYNGGYGVIQDPFGLGLTFAVHGYAQRADTSATNGNTQDVVMEFEVSLDCSWNLAPLSTANESVVFQAGLTT